MREITFRGASVDTGEWVYGYYGKLEVMEGQKHYIITPTVTFTQTVSAYFTDNEVIPETVGQYTEIKDDYGKQIYEGDLVELKCPLIASTHLDITGVVKMIEGEWCIDSGKELRGLWTETNNIRVIGNVREHPHLLKGE